MLLAVGAYLIFFDGVTGDDETDCIKKQVKTVTKTHAATIQRVACQRANSAFGAITIKAKCRPGTCQPGETTMISVFPGARHDHCGGGRLAKVDDVNKRFETLKAGGKISIPYV